MECPECGYDPCACQEILDAYYALNPDAEPTGCIGCGHTYNAGSLHDGLCDRCWYVHDPNDDEGIFG